MLGAGDVEVSLSLHRGIATRAWVVAGIETGVLEGEKGGWSHRMGFYGTMPEQAGRAQTLFSHLCTNLLWYPNKTNFVLHRSKRKLVVSQQFWGGVVRN